MLREADTLHRISGMTVHQQSLRLITDSLPLLSDLVGLVEQMKKLGDFATKKNTAFCECVCTSLCVPCLYVIEFKSIFEVLSVNWCYTPSQP